MGTPKISEIFHYTADYCLLFANLCWGTSIDSALRLAESELSVTPEMRRRVAKELYAIGYGTPISDDTPFLGPAGRLSADYMFLKFAALVAEDKEAQEAALQELADLGQELQT